MRGCSASTDDDSHGVSCHPAISDGISCRPGSGVKGVARQLVKRIIPAYVTRPGLMPRALLNHSWNGSGRETQAAAGCCKTWVLFSSCISGYPRRRYLESNLRENTESPLRGPSNRISIPRRCRSVSPLILDPFFDLKFKEEVAFAKGCIEVSLHKCRRAPWSFLNISCLTDILAQLFSDNLPIPIWVWLELDRMAYPNQFIFVQENIIACFCAKKKY